MSKEIEETEAERHRAKMAKRKAVQDAEVADKKIEKGLLIVHTGTGKGKSTAAFGLALRMLGRGKRIGVVQFIKGAWQSAERDALETFGDQVVWHTMGEGFTWDTQDLKRDVAAAERAWAKARELMADETLSLVILDELNIALRYDYSNLQSVIAELQARRGDLHVVVTGRNAKPDLIAAADLVTDMSLVKHHFAAGVKAQPGHRVLDRGCPRHHVPGHRLGRRQVAAGRGAGARLHAARIAGAAVQAAEHVEQRGGGGRRRRDRPRPGLAGARRAGAAERAHESDPAEAAEPGRRADRGAGQGARQRQGRRIPGA